MGKFKRQVCLVIVCSMLAVAGFFTLLQGQESSNTEGQPQISIEETSYDAGEVWEGETVLHDFIVKNTGIAELTISQVKVG